MQSSEAHTRSHAYLSKKRIYNLIWISLLALLGVCSAAMYTRLGIQVDDVRQKRFVAQSECDELELEVKRMNRLIEYSKMNEYRQQLAVDKLGYVGPDDIKFIQSADEAKGEIEIITEDDY